MICKDWLIVIMGKRKPEDTTFWSAIRDIRQLAAQRMTARERRKFHLSERLRQGKPVKGPKIPYNILQGMRKKEKERERLQRADAKRSGLWKPNQNNSQRRNKGK